MLAQMEDMEADEGLAAARRALARTCLATREVVPVARMIRFVAAPDGSVVPDLSRDFRDAAHGLRHRVKPSAKRSHRRRSHAHFAARRKPTKGCSHSPII